MSVREHLDCRRLLAAGLGVLAFVAAPLVAQESEGQGQEQPAPAQEQPRVQPTVSQPVGERLNALNVCMEEEEDPQCALEIIEQIQRMRNLTSFEMATVWNYQAFIYYDLDNVEGAMEAYGNILGLPREELTENQVQNAMRNLAVLHLDQENYEEGLDLYLEWMALPVVVPTLTPGDYFMLASIYYSLDQYEEGIPPVERAISMAAENGEIGDEAWYVMLYYFQYQLQRMDDAFATIHILVEHYTKKQHVLTLAGMLSERERHNDTLTLYEAAYGVDWLSGLQKVQLANLYLSVQTPIKAAHVLDEGLADGSIEPTWQNYRLLAQSWQNAQEHRRAIPAFERASELAEDGTVDQLLAQSYERLAEYEDCAVAAERALDRGGLTGADYVHMLLGQCLLQLERFDDARAAFQEAARLGNESRQRDARRFIGYIADEVERIQYNAERRAGLRTRADLED